MKSISVLMPSSSSPALIPPTSAESKSEKNVLEEYSTVTSGVIFLRVTHGFEKSKLENSTDLENKNSSVLASKVLKTKNSRESKFPLV